MAAVDPARAALLEEVDAADVGDHLGAVVEGERLATHLFACTRRGYAGWRWSVTVARAPRQKTGHRRRGRAAPRRRGDRRPAVGALPRAHPARRPLARRPAARRPTTTRGWSRRTPSATTRSTPTRRPRSAASPRSSASAGSAPCRSRAASSPPSAGTTAPAAPSPRSPRPPPRRCRSCGFLVRIAGPMADSFGVCANGDANDDGRVVSFDHGCGAHSEVRLARKHEPPPLPEPVHDTLNDDEIVGPSSALAALTGRPRDGLVPMQCRGPAACGGGSTPGRRGRGRSRRGRSTATRCGRRRRGHSRTAAARGRHQPDREPTWTVRMPSTSSGSTSATM